MGQVFDEIMEGYAKHGWDKTVKEHKCFSCSKDCKESLITGLLSFCPQYRNVNSLWVRFVRWLKFWRKNER